MNYILFGFIRTNAKIINSKNEKDNNNTLNYSSYERNIRNKDINNKILIKNSCIEKIDIT
jgi:hypothetical protein